MNYKLINKHSGKDLTYTDERIVDFLHTHLDQYGDAKADIQKCIDYVFDPHRGGNIILALDDQQDIAGAVILNDTGMSGYIPENILVYIAVHQNQRGKGLGKELMQQAIKITSGNIALHVEPDNPAVHLYQKVGFTNKYLEMRLQKS
jgi:ribosomal protein S18 acetylase RimI-like enzyme